MQLSCAGVRKQSIRAVYVAAILGVLVGVFGLAPILLRNNGQYMEYGDYTIQYVPFIMELKRMIGSGSLAWSWNSFLGDNFINAYSYYTVYNPFAWLVSAFPNRLILYGTLLATLLKLSVSMSGAFLFFRRFCSKDIFALIGALLYTFSGFTNVNSYFYFFLDVIAVFPWLLYGLELLISERKRGVYLAALVLNAAINYYFFVSTVIIVVLYVFFRLELYRIASWKAGKAVVLLRVTLYSVIGTGMAGFALIPCLNSVLHSGKAMGALGSKISLQIFPQRILQRLCALIAPSESGVYRVFYEGGEWGSTGAFLPVFGVSCVILRWFFKRDWMSLLSMTLLVFYLVPMLNDIFVLFTTTEYTRWLYGLVLVYALVTVVTLEEYVKGNIQIDRRVLAGVLIFIAAYLLMPTMVYILEYFGIRAANRFMSICQSPHFLGYGALGVMLLLTSANNLLLWKLLSGKQFREKTALCCVVLMAMVNMLVFNELNYDRHDVDSAYSNQAYYEKTMVEGTVESSSVFTHRIDHSEHIRNYGLYKNRASVNYFNSLQNPWALRYALATGIAEGRWSTVLLTQDDSRVFTDALLSVKYYYDYDRQTVIPEGFAYLRSENGVDIYENINYLPIGFTYADYCLETDLMQLTPADRAKAMLSKLVISGEDEHIVKRYLNYESLTDQDADFAHAIQERRKNTASFFEGNSVGFNAFIDLPHDDIVFFSIPNDSGWTIRVNGNPAETFEANYGLMAIICQAGANEITAQYHPAGIHLGGVCTGIFVLCLMIVEFFGKKRENGILV